MAASELIKWLNSDDTGVSSKAIVAYMEGIEPGRFGYDYPHDPSDLGRCLRLLDIMPEYKARLKHMKHLSPVWRNLIQNWNEISALYYEEYPTGRAPKCYDRMKALIEAGRNEQVI